jgi:hypothetical protein
MHSSRASENGRICARHVIPKLRFKFVTRRRTESTTSSVEYARVASCASKLGADVERRVCKRRGMKGEALERAGCRTRPATVRALSSDTRMSNECERDVE